MFNGLAIVRTEGIHVELRRACSLSEGLRLAEDMSKSLTCDNGSDVLVFAVSSAIFTDLINRLYFGYAG